MISSGQDKDSELHVSAKVEGDYDEGVKQIAELYRWLVWVLARVSSKHRKRLQMDLVI